MTRKADKKPKKNKASGPGKKCKKCSLDCDVNRRMTYAHIKDTKERKEAMDKAYDMEPMYTALTCPKK